MADSGKNSRGFWQASGITSITGDQVMSLSKHTRSVAVLDRVAGASRRRIRLVATADFLYFYPPFDAHSPYAERFSDLTRRYHGRAPQLIIGLVTNSRVSP
ncbi:MAG: hypothetical protein CMJ64_20815 [Planctomycetaceae bacterium]|nr:hypothetical protein [Planctomycetaceae bacterium]